MGRRRDLLLTTIAAVATAVPAATSTAKTSHTGWPAFDGTRYINQQDVNGGYVGTPLSDELLGGHGNDILDGGPGADVLWGDFKPTGQPAAQTDTLIGGEGNDFLYASHGRNTVSAGPGNDRIFAHYGSGVIDCSTGHDVVYVSHRGRRGWQLRSCERVSYRTPRG